MPASEATVIVGLDADGVREGKALARLFPNASVYVSPKSLGPYLRDFRSIPLFVIFVSHFNTGQGGFYELAQLGQYRDALPPIVVLAMCSSGTQDSFAGFTLAQRLAIAWNREIRATTRFLGFSEVGTGTAFAKSGIADFILPNNDPDKGTAGLWVTVDPKAATGVEALSVGIANVSLQ